MSSALSRAEADGALRCPMRMLYGMAAQRRSRNAAAFGMFGIMALTLALCTALLAERTISLPTMQMRRVELVHTQFRTVSEKERMRPEMKKILTEESDFEIPAEPEVKPEPEKPVLPEPKPEPKMEVKPTKPEVKPKPELKAKPKPRPKPEPAAKKPVQKAETVRQVPAAAVSPAEASVSGTATVSVPGAAGSEKAEKSRKSEVLAAILQAVEKHKRYPRQGRRSGTEGTCTLMVQVGADGRVVSCSLAEPSGHTVLDIASRRLGEKLVGLDVGSRGSIRVLVPVHYRLTDR